MVQIVLKRVTDSIRIWLYLSLWNCCSAVYVLIFYIMPNHDFGIPIVYIISMILSLQFLKYCKFHRSLKLWRRAIYNMEYLKNSNSRKDMFNSDDSWAMIFPLNPSPSHLKRNCEYFLRTLTLVYSLSCQLAKLLIFQIVNDSLRYFSRGRKIFPVFIVV